MPIRRPAAAIGLAAGLVVIAGGTVGLLLTRQATPAMRPVAAGVAALPLPTGPIVAPPPSAAPRPVAAPVSLTIPLVGVQTRLITLGLMSDGELQVPSSTAVAGWYTGSPRPGAVGSAIIVGHIDSLTGPGVFYRLSLRHGGALTRHPGRMTPEQRYEDLVEEFAGEDGVLPPHGGSGFGRGALRYRKKIFAMLVRGRLVVKLPRQRVDELVHGGHGDRFDANKGTPMKEWFSLDPESGLAWPPLAREALDFARGA